MNNYIYYKDYVGDVNYTAEDGVLFGRVLGIKASLSYEGDSVNAVINDFHDAIDEYLELCAKNGVQPEVSTFIPLKDAAGGRLVRV